ncbi:MAG: condensation domain-containing protein, partial [Segetibacter sp.]
LSAYILDANKRLVPAGVAGELYIAGAGLARGYLNRPELSAERFIHNPFNKEGTSRLYKTGDLGRWLPDGSIEYLGRIDEQVKIRGYRIELGEIETVLLQSGLVEQAVITAKHDANGNKRLIGYVVADGEFDKQTIISYLHNKLPDYMVPVLWVQLQSLPLTSNGKTDKKKLPEPDATELSGNEYVAPVTEIQQQLAAIWQQVLGIEKVGISDNFFEIGGHSLLAMRAISAIRKELTVELAIKDLFVKPTINELSAYIETQSKGSSLPAIVALARPERIPLSYSQERLWFIDKLEGSTQYHIPLVLRLKGQLNKEALNKALQHIVNRHEVLRTVFRESEGLAYQSVTDKDNWNLLTIDGSGYKDNLQSLQQYVQHLISQPFDFTKDYMLRAALITLTATEHVLVVTMHHIASDAWSMPIFVKEVVKLYKAYEENEAIQLAPLPIQYADYAIWQRTYLDGDILNKKLDYWKEKLQDVAPLQLPADFARPAVWTAKGAITGFDIDRDLSTNLLHLSQQQGATLFITLLAAFKVLLHRYSGQKDICVGTPIANRTQHDIEQLLGFFVNTLAFRSEVDSNLSFVDFLKQVKATTLDGLQHQEVPFEKVVDAVVTERDMSRSPLFQVAFALQNIAEVGQLNFGKVQLSGEAFAHNSAKFDITFYLKETPNGLQGSVEYATDLYREETIQRMIAHYKQLLLSVSEDAHQKIASLQMLTRSEEHRLL